MPAQLKEAIMDKARMIVTCSGGTRFDRAYYVGTHLPLTLEAWSPHGLEAAAAFFPAGDGADTVSVGIYTFRDEAAMRAALGSPATERVMGDVRCFTDAKVVQSLAAPV